MKKMTVMYIWNDLAIGGAALSLVDMLYQIKECVNCIVVIRQKSSMVELFEKLKISYYVVPFSCDYGKKNDNLDRKAEVGFIDDYEMSKQIVTIVEKEKVDLIHINSSVSNVGAIAAIIAGIPYVWHIRELISDHYGCCYYDEKLKKELFVKADKLITISDCVKEIIDERYGVESIRLYNGLNIEKYRMELSKEYNFKFLIAGELTEEKGQWDAIRAVELLINRGFSEVELFIIGGNNDIYKWVIEKYLINKKLTNNIHILGFENDLKRYRKMVSYSITSSKMEALGRTTIEAMLSGNIVIGANTGGTKELIGDNEERGYLYKQGDYVDLARAMQQAIEDSESKKNQMRYIAQEYAEKNFDSKRYCIDLCNIYRSLNRKKMTSENISYSKYLLDKYKKLKKNKEIYYDEQMQELSIQNQKNQLAFLWSTRWIQAIQKGFSIKDYLLKNEVNSVAIYGMAQLGCRVFDELENSKITIKYVMDRNNTEASRIINMVNPNEDLPEVDAIIVTVLSQEKELIRWLEKRCAYKVFGLSQIISDLLQEKM